MLIFLSISIFVIICIFLIFLYHFLHKNDTFCRNINSLFDLYKTKNNIKFHYIKLNFYPTKNKLNKLLVIKNESNLFCNDSVIKNRDFIIKISKLIDYSLLNNNISYRSKNNIPLIENISKILVYNFKNSFNNNLLAEYKKYNKIFNIKQKENKVAKLLIGRELIFYLIENLNEIDIISKIINKSKTAKYFKFYDNLLYNLAEFYGISKFNNNANKFIISNNLDKFNLDQFYNELFFYEYKIKQTVNYLTVMFN